MKKLFLSILISIIFVTLLLIIDVFMYNSNPSDVIFLIIMLITVLVTPIISSLVASIGNTKMNKTLIGALSALSSGVVSLIPFYFFFKSNAMNAFLNSVSSWGSSSNNSIVSVDINITFSGFINQIIYWIVAGTIAGTLVNVFHKRKLRKIG
ncbi:hypothetical protein P8845_06390 [Bacillus spizizenii]|nr:hypothetical protein [Bacillus spizizenii]MCY7886740.1 hypothetical protein [Bacillus spizizenii]MCY8125668.1 hypothetical protein [Bacillus spizizenii]MCY8166582.1 hypothetical protein [Bacillus spizizenii]MCY8189743.1 hypothetical protein [Bacillus spizizenii]